MTNAAISIFNITKFPLLRSNIPSSSPYCVFISQLTCIRYAGTCSSNECFIQRSKWPSNKLLKQWYTMKSSFTKLYGRYGSYWSIWSVHLANVKWNSEARPVTVTSQPFKLYTNFMTLIPNLTFTELRDVSMTNQQWAYTLSYTCYIPFSIPAKFWQCHRGWWSHSGLLWGINYFSHIFKK